MAACFPIQVKIPAEILRQAQLLHEKIDEIGKKAIAAGIQPVTISADLERKPLFELGRIPPYDTFPANVSREVARRGKASIIKPELQARQVLEEEATDEELLGLARLLDVSLDEPPSAEFVAKFDEHMKKYCGANWRKE